MPARLECSGILPDSVKLPADVPAELAEGILLAAPGYERAITLDLGSHPEHRLIVARILPILRAAGADVQVEGAKVRVNPGPLSLPAQPQAGMAEVLKNAGYEFQMPAGAFYFFPKAPGGDDVAFVNRLVEERVLAVPGSGFGCPGYFRLAFCVGEEVIRKAADGFAKARASVK